MSKDHRIKGGAFVISLDFELFWGFADFAEFRDWQDKIEKVWDVVPALLRLFTKYNIHATWATVGGLLAKDKEDFLKFSPNPPSLELLELSERLWPEGG
jgi:hypothetical protein